MIAAMLIAIGLFFANSAISADSSAVDHSIEKIIHLISKHNRSLQAVKKAHAMAKHIETASGFLPDPTIKANIFGSPIETRNGPQTSNFTFNQPIPLFSTLHKEKQLAASTAAEKREGIEVLLLELQFEARMMLYKYAELSEKTKNKKKTLAALNKLSEVVLARLKFGSTDQLQVSRLQIEITELKQSLTLIKAKLTRLEQILRSMAGGKDLISWLPKALNSEWMQVQNFDISKINLSSHPIMQQAKNKMKTAQIEYDLVKLRHLPKFTASISWMQIDKPNDQMGNPNASKDAWAIGAALSIPIWRAKYDAIEAGSKAKEIATKYDLEQTELTLKAEVQSIYQELKSTHEITSMYKHDILPRAIQNLKLVQESYTQEHASFDQVIENYLRVMKFEDMLIESRSKQAVLNAALKRLLKNSLPKDQDRKLKL